MLTVDFKRLFLPRGARILDVGCGTGRHAAGAYHLTDATVFAGDIKTGDLLQARERLRFHDALGAHGSGTWTLFAGDVTALPFKAESFHCAICSEVLEHVPAHEKAVAELNRVLKPGGHLVVSVPRFYPEAVCWRLSKEYPDPSGGGHIRIYRSGHIRSLLEKGGFTLRGGHHAHSLHSPYWWLKCLVGVRREDAATVNLYHRFLTWDILSRPRLTRFIDWILNPVLGKSLVVYARKRSVPTG